MEGVLQESLKENPVRADFLRRRQINGAAASPSDDLSRSRANDGEFCVSNASGKHMVRVPNARIKDKALAVHPDRASLFLLIKACGIQKDLHKGSIIHADILERGLLAQDLSLSNALISMYAKCGALAKAQELFNELPVKNVVTWNALISAYAQNGLGDEALSCFRRMRDQGFSPNSVTFTCILKACGSIREVNVGEEIHAEAHRQGLIEKHRVLGTALVDMYAKSGALAKAQGVFDKLPALDAVTWTALIAGYAQHGLGNEAMHCYEQMRDKGFYPDRVTFLCVLKACGSTGATEKGEEIHDELSRQGLLEQDNGLGMALVDMYVKCGKPLKAQGVFDKLPIRTVVAWNTLITGYIQHGLGDEALSCFEQMQNEGLSPDAVTFNCILKACGSIGGADIGEEIHVEVGRQGLLEKDTMLGTAVVDMYAKCGELAKARDVFDELSARGVATWTALMAGYAQVGEVKTVFELFIKMIEGDVQPDKVTFIVLLTACSHAGLVEDGQVYFDSMTTVYGIVPTFEHCTCMIDILSRAGLFDKAINVIEKVPPSEYYLLWLALMGACRKWVNVELGRWVFEQAIQLDRKSTAAYVCMSNIYAAAGMQEEVGEVEALRMRNGAWNMPGRCWWTSVNKHVYSFTVGDSSDFQDKHIRLKLLDIERKLQLEGYSLHWVSNHTLGGKIDNVLCGHSEKLAIAWALINTAEGTPVRVTKNMRTCGDCHFATSLISKLEKRQIQVIDANCIHIFEGGRCFCEDHSRR